MAPPDVAPPPTAEVLATGGLPAGRVEPFGHEPLDMLGAVISVERLTAEWGGPFDKLRPGCATHGIPGKSPPL